MKFKHRKDHFDIVTLTPLMGQSGDRHMGWMAVSVRACKAWARLNIDVVEVVR